ncbi:hypothetical protein A2U01_0087856, partial [Trifolium medium]|nr:hypothetical protein [Trifolium medium]
MCGGGRSEESSSSGSASGGSTLRSAKTTSLEVVGLLYFQLDLSSEPCN